MKDKTGRTGTPLEWTCRRLAVADTRLLGNVANRYLSFSLASRRRLDTGGKFLSKLFCPLFMS